MYYLEKQNTKLDENFKKIILIFTKSLKTKNIFNL